MIPPALASGFPDIIRARGAAYHAAGRVLVLASGDGSAAAMVMGSRQYQVLVSSGLDEEPAAFFCDCPFFEDHEYCKHVWATLLALEEEGSLEEVLEPEFHERLPARRGRVPAARRGGRARGRPARKRAPAPPEWVRTLRLVRSTMGEARDTEAATWPSNRRINYIIDVARTQAYGGLVVELATQAADRRTGWRSPKRFAYSQEQWLATPDPLDREIAGLLIGARAEWMATPNPRGTFRIDRAAFDPILRLMCETGRCKLRREERELDPETVTWDGGDPWEARVRLDPGASNITASLVLHRPGDGGTLDAALLLESGLAIAEGRMARLEYFGAYPLVALLCAGPLAVPKADLAAFLGTLYALPHLPPVEAPPELGITETRPQPVPHAAITIVPGPAWQSQAGAPVELSFDYGGVVLPFQLGGPTHFDPATMRLVHRDRAAEQAALDRLQEFGIRWRHDYVRNLKVPHLPLSRVDAAVDALARAGWTVDFGGRPVRHATSYDIGVRSGIDWFDLSADFDFGGLTVSLPQLLAGLRDDGNGVTLPDGSIGLLPREWRDRWTAVAGLTDMVEDALRFKPSQVALLDALLATLPDASVDQVFERARTRLRRFDGVQSAPEPPGFVGTLRPYQREGLGWFDFLRDFGFGGCLADDMGLGKTIQVLALLQARHRAGAGPALVVVPRSLISNWIREAAGFTPELRVLDHSGAARGDGKAAAGSCDVMVTTYGVLRHEAAALCDVEFDYIILDEAQAIKNARTASAKAARLLKGRHRLVLTGTPVENRLADLWSLFDFLNPGMLSAGLLRTLTKGGDGLNEERRAFLARALRPFILRRTKAQVAPDLPERLEQTLYVDLEPAQRKLYDELRTHYRTALLDRVASVGVRRSRIQILEALLRLRQAACHPGLLDRKRAADGGGKLEVLESRLVEAAAEGHKALVFSQFTSLLVLLKPRLEAAGVTYEYLDGKTRDRQRRVDRFQTDPACTAFLISLKAGGQGFNLTAAEYVFLLDPWWNPAVEAQAIDRAHRIGQTRRVFATRLIARDTVEEKVLELQRAKRDLADAIITEDNSVITKIEREDLEFLLS